MLVWGRAPSPVQAERSSPPTYSTSRARLYRLLNARVIHRNGRALAN